VTRTLVTASDLSADLIAPGFASQRFWATAIYPIAWSPDGSALAAWVALENAEGARMGLVTVSADGRQRRLWLVANWLGKVTWSPDGRHLTALTRAHGETPRRLLPLRVWTAATHTGVETTVEGSNFAWSPDGRWLAVEQPAGPAVFSADLEAVWRLPPGCRIGGWRPR
jgi:dipeptidyl aminopeptidase/acylaminoacyl peptidase